MRERDDRDRNRKDSPLRPAPDAVIIDSTALTLDEVLERIESIVKNGQSERPKFVPNYGLLDCGLRWSVLAEPSDAWVCAGFSGASGFSGFSGLFRFFGRLGTRHRALLQLQISVSRAQVELHAAASHRALKSAPVAAGR